MTTHAAEAPAGRAASFLHRFEGGVPVAAFLLSMTIPLIDALGRPFHGFRCLGAAEYRASSRCGWRCSAARWPRGCHPT
jgi:hypothetical protein